MKEKIAIVLTDQDAVFAATALSRYDIYLFAAQGSPGLHWLRQLSQPPKIVEYAYRAPLTDKYLHEIIIESDVTQRMKQHGIRHLLPTQKVTKELYEWSWKNGVELLSVDYSMQNDFEDKIDFDRFMTKYFIQKPVSRTYQYMQGDMVTFYPAVIQKRDSWGSEGTYIVENKEDIMKLHTAGSVPKNETLLVREYIPGNTYGITVSVSSRMIALSAVRVQCYLSESARSRFLGIQWLPTASLSAQLLGAINATFSQIGRIMHTMGFVGPASFDFMVRGDDVFVIECNPRFSAATAQLIEFPELAGTSLLDDMIADLLDERPETPTAGPAHRDVPDSSFAGSVMEIVAGSPTDMTAPKECGVYEMSRDTIAMTGPDIRAVPMNQPFATFYSDAVSGQKYEPDTTTGTVLSTFPLFTPDGRLLPVGDSVMKFFSLAPHGDR